MSWLKSRSDKAIPEGLSRRSQRQRLFLEALECRLTPTTAAVLQVTATHSFVSQLGAAASGDTLQIEPGAVIGTLGTSGLTTAAAQPGDTTLQVNTAFAPGQIIQISDTGDTTETALVDSVSGSAGAFTLTLHNPLHDSHQDGSTVTAAPNTLGIGKGITIQGDPNDAPSSLLSGTTLEYFAQNGPPAPDALIHLSLSAVSGVASSNLSITGDAFPVASGSIDPIDVVAGGALTISNDAFTIGNSAAIATVVSGQTNAGAITFSGDAITSSSNLSASAVELTSTSGPISVTSVSLSVTGTIGGDGVSISTAGNVLVGGTNKIHATGAVTDSALDVSDAANASISNVTVMLSSSAGGDGVKVDTANGNLTASNLSATIGGSVQGNFGEGAALDLQAYGDGSVSNLSAAVGGSANYGTYVDVDGNLTISGVETTKVTGAVTSEGMYLYASEGNVKVSTGLTVILGSSAYDGLELEADGGTLTVTGAVAVSVAGNVSDEGAYLYGDSTATVGAVTATLGGTADYGIDLEAYTLTTEGTIVATVTGAVNDDAVYLESYYGPLTVNYSVTATLSSSTDTGVYLYAEEGNLIDHSPITANITGAVSDYGLYVYAGNNATLTGKVQTTIGGAAYDGVYIDASDGALADTAGATVKITGAVSDYAAYFYGTTTSAIANVTVMASDIASGEGVYIETEDGGNPLTISNINVTANDGTSSAYGVDIYSEYGGPIVASGITVHMNAAAEYGLYLETYYSGSVSLSNVSVDITGATDYGVYFEQEEGGGGTRVSNVSATVGGAVADEGVYLYGEDNGAMVVNKVTTTLGGSAAYGVYAYSYGGLAVTGALNASVTSAVSDYGVYINSEYGDVVVSSPITVTLGSTAEYGVYVESDSGAVTVSAPETVSIAGDVSDDGIYLESYGNLLVAGKLSAKLSATTGADGGGVELYSDNGSATNTAPITMSIAAPVSSDDEGFYAYGDSGLTLSNVTDVMKGGSLGYGDYLETSYGNISIKSLTITVTGGAVTDDGLYLYAEDSGDVTASNVNVSLGSSADDGVYVYAGEGNVTMTNTTDSVGGAVSDGAYVYSGAAMNISSMTVNLGGSSNYALDAEAYYENLAANALHITQTGAASTEGALLESNYGNLNWSNSTIALNGGLSTASEYAVQVEAEGNVSVSGDTITVMGSTAAGLTASANGSLSATKTSVTTGGGVALLLSGSSGNPQSIENDVFNTNGAGTGLAFSGGASVVALVQGDDFEHNLVGVAITGDGANAGDIDLGGGLLGSQGKNKFGGFTGASGNYAIALNGTNASSTVDALDNTFTVANPNTVVQDSANNGGTGIIDV